MLTSCTPHVHLETLDDLCAAYQHFETADGLTSGKSCHVLDRGVVERRLNSRLSILYLSPLLLIETAYIMRLS